MIEAMYGVEFSSDVDMGYGVVIFETGRIFGGDSSCVYVGEYGIKDDILAVRVRVTNDRKLLNTVVRMDDFSLAGSVRLKNDGYHVREFVMHGEVVGYPGNKIAVKFTRRAELP